MRIVSFFFLASILIGCKTPMASTASNPETMEQINQCPEEAKCTLIAEQNKALEIKEDGIGAIYPAVTEGNNIVVQYHYLKEAPEGIADGNYSESIYFEIPSDVDRLTKSDASLQDLNMLFGKHFFSPESGYFIVENGRLEVKRIGDELQLNLVFDMKEKVHRINGFKMTVTLE